MSTNLFIVKFTVKGIVQGVGFRPFVVKNAKKYNLKGWVLNDSNGVTLKIEGTERNITLFINEMKTNPPALAMIDKVNRVEKRKSNGVYSSFTIKKSVEMKHREALVSPDSDVCDDCLSELHDPKNRRYGYPFINCTNCGPRYSIIQDIPYDRKNTTMKNFVMCNKCKEEYENILDRRFHAQPIACWDCGPQLRLLDSTGNEVICKDPIKRAIKLLQEGKILAVKGIGGFHLMADPTQDEVVCKLRARKRRKHKPLALLSENIEEVKKYCKVWNEEEKVLKSNQRPILILEKKMPEMYSTHVAPNNKFYGVMLAYTPIQHLILHNNFGALVCTSANIIDHPIIYKNEEIIESVSNIADYILIHNRDIETRIDDSIVRVYKSPNKPNYVSDIRRARSYCPYPILISKTFPTGLGLGAELKNTICLNRDQKFFLSQHLGDLKNNSTYESFKECIKHLEKLLELKPKFIACDMHPDYYNTRYALNQGVLPVYQVQHHHAHMASCMAENGLENKKTLGIIFDGVGYGEDGNLWGGEFFVGNYLNYKRYAHFDYIPLLGGDIAVKEPYRIAIALLYQLYGKSLFGLKDLSVISNRKDGEIEILTKMAEKGINSPLSSSVGRIFDGISSLLGVCEYTDYEGQAAIELEQTIDSRDRKSKPYEYLVFKKNENIINLNYMIKGVVDDLSNKKSKSLISSRFHNTIVQICLDMANRARKEDGVQNIVLSGGAFQNVYLLENIEGILEYNNFRVYHHKLVPTNDGGISLGQLVVAGHRYLER